MDCRFDLSLVLPAFNEERRLPGALASLAAFSEASGLALDVIVADDGSDDATAAVATGWQGAGGPHVPHFRVRLTQLQHRGKGAAVRAGLVCAEAPVVGYCDVDLSAGPDAIAALHACVKDGADVAMASRGLPESVLEVRQPWYRERAGRAFNFLLRRVTGLPYRDTQCGLKLFRRHAADEVFRHQRLDGFAFDAEVVVLALRLGFSVEEVPVRWAHSPDSRVAMVRDSLRMGRDIVRIVRMLRKVGVHALGVPTPEAIELMAAAEERHWVHVAKRGLIGQALAAANAPGPALDVGCGAGAMLSEVGRAMPAFGVDLSPQCLSHARARGLEGLVRANGHALPFTEASFGVVLALDVVEHHPRPEALLAEVRRVLKPGGCFVVTVPAFQWMWSYHDHLLGHYRRYTRPVLLAELAAAGLAVERVTYFHSWLLPVAWVFRKVRSVAGRGDTPDDFLLPDVLNRALLAIAARERRYVRARGLPFGLSILAVARPAGSACAGDRLGAERIVVSLDHGAGGHAIVLPEPESVPSILGT